jgi:hypothetical protein
MHLNSTISSKENFNSVNLPVEANADESEAASNSQQIQMRMMQREHEIYVLDQGTRN